MKHAWVEVLNPEKNRITDLIDSNYTKSTHSNYNDYLDEVERISVNERGIKEFMKIRETKGVEGIVIKEIVIAEP